MYQGGGPPTDLTLADKATLLSAPPWMRRGHTLAKVEAQPAAGAGWTFTPSGTYWERPVAVNALLTTSSQAGNRVPFFFTATGDGTVIAQVQAGPAIPAGTAWTLSSSVSGLPVIQAGQAVTAYGTVTGPTTGQQITSLALAAGVYTIGWELGVGGTTSNSDVNNMALEVAGVTVSQGWMSSGSGNFNQQLAYTAFIPAGGATVSINAIGAGTATAIYRAQLVAQQTSPLASFTTLPDITLQAGWQFGLSLSGVQTNDQLSGILFTRERYPSNWADGSLQDDDEDRVRDLLIRLAHTV